MAAIHAVTMGRARRLGWMAALGAGLVAAGCGGGGDSAPPAPSPVVADPVAVSDPNVPALTGNTATDGFNRFNFRRQQAGLAPLARNAAIDVAAQGHSDYQRVNNITTHVQEAGKPNFTGAQVGDRLRAAGYALPSNSFAFGEVIATRFDASGAAAAEDLIGAIYHRFLVMEPMYKEGGAGAAVSGTGATYFTSDFAARGLDSGIARGAVAVYPFAGEAGVPTAVNSDAETPDPVPNQNRIGYPVSVHANLVSTVNVQSFTIRPHGGDELPIKLLTSSNDPETPASAAAILPLATLVPGTTYDVQFAGLVDGAAVNKSWSFTTQ